MKNKEFKIFSTELNIDLKDFLFYLDIKHDEILSNSLKERNTLTDLIVKKYTKMSNAPTKLNQKYNIFEFNNNHIKSLYSSLLQLTKNASSYYGYNFDDQNYMIRGWFNADNPSTKDFNPNNNKRLFHDHLGGFGAPDFHGYYCVDAEPSITYYKIEEGNVYENKNKNNRAILCQNGFPHSRGNWNECNQRITIAYDIVPQSRLTYLNINNPIWMKFE